MKRFSVYEMIILLLLVVLMVVLLFVNVSFFRSYQRTNAITQTTISEMQENVNGLKGELSSIGAVQEEMGSKLGKVEQDVADTRTEHAEFAKAMTDRQDALEARMEGDSKQRNVTMIFPKATPEEIRRSEEKQEAQARMRESVDALVQRFGSLEEQMQADRRKLDDSVADLTKKIKITLDYAQDNRLQIEALSTRVDEALAGVRRLDDENRLMHYNYDAVLSAQYAEKEKSIMPEATTPETEEVEKVVEETVNEPVEDSEEATEMTESTAPVQKKRFFLIRFFQWIGGIFS